MTKAQREKAERLLLKQMLETNPKLKEILDGVIENPNPQLNDIIQPLIEEKLKEARIIGANIGWQSAFLRCEEAIKDMEHPGQIKAYVHEEANKVRDTLGLKKEA